MTSSVFDRVPSALPALLRGAERGDWRMRTACLSAVGQRARARSFAAALADIALGRAPDAGPGMADTAYQGRHVLGRVADALVDRAWPVRVAAALALGEFRTPAVLGPLQPLLGAPYRAERVAAAAAMLSCGGSVEGGPALLAGALSTPLRIGDATRSVEVLDALARAHASVLERWRDVPGQPQPPGGGPDTWGRFLAGPPIAEPPPDLRAEIDRYVNEDDVEYLLTKPFTPINNAQNPGLLHAFLVACGQLRLPPEARVLDLGGGSGWVSELLARFGFQPVTIDVSTALLAIGKRRFARGGLSPRFAAGDMRRLPIADGAVQGVIVLDALHHVPDVAAVFAEAYRVLDAGGALVLAEPGEGHAETARARAEMREYGVQEREIHAAEMFAYARRAGFDDVRMVPHAEPGITLTEAQLTAAMTSEADGWMVLNKDRPGYLMPYLMQSMFDHPILVARKGRRVVDSRAPSVLRADLSARLGREGARVRGTVTARNTGDTIWLAGSTPGHVQLGIQLLGTDRRLLAHDFARAPFSGRVGPAESVVIAVEITLPDATTPYVLKLDLVDEGVCWFQDVGSTVAYFEG